MTPHPRITLDPAVMLGKPRIAGTRILGKPCIAGTRITVELILRWLGAGRTTAELTEAYPQITGKDVSAALGYARRPNRRPARHPSRWIWVQTQIKFIKLLPPLNVLFSRQIIG
jgi:uncharacterized protein (DUF433 family)